MDRCPQCLLVLAAVAMLIVVLGGAILIGHVSVWMSHAGT